MQQEHCRKLRGGWAGQERHSRVGVAEKGESGSTFDYMRITLGQQMCYFKVFLYVYEEATLNTAQF